MDTTHLDINYNAEKARVEASLKWVLGLALAGKERMDRCLIGRCDNRDGDGVDNTFFEIFRQLDESWSSKQLNHNSHHPSAKSKSSATLNFFVRDQQGITSYHIKSVVVKALASGHIYGYASCEIFLDPGFMRYGREGGGPEDRPSFDFSHLLNAMAQEIGPEFAEVIQDAGLYEASLTRENPFNLDGHMQLIDGLMRIRVRTIIQGHPQTKFGPDSIEPQTDLIYSLRSILECETEAIDHQIAPNNIEGQLAYCINQICFKVQDFIKGSKGVTYDSSFVRDPNLPLFHETCDIMSDLRDGTSLCGLLFFFYPDEFSLQKVYFPLQTGHQNITSGRQSLDRSKHLHETKRNWELIKSFVVSHPEIYIQQHRTCDSSARDHIDTSYIFNTFFALTLQDWFMFREDLYTNIIVFIAELLKRLVCISQREICEELEAEANVNNTTNRRDDSQTEGVIPVRSVPSNINPGVRDIGSMEYFNANFGGSRPNHPGYPAISNKVGGSYGTRQTNDGFFLNQSIDQRAPNISTSNHSTYEFAPDGGISSSLRSKLEMRKRGIQSLKKRKVLDARRRKLEVGRELYQKLLTSHHGTATSDLSKPFFPYANNNNIINNHHYYNDLLPQNFSHASAGSGSHDSYNNITTPTTTLREALSSARADLHQPNIARRRGPLLPYATHPSPNLNPDLLRPKHQSFTLPIVASKTTHTPHWASKYPEAPNYTGSSGYRGPDDYATKYYPDLHKPGRHRVPFSIPKNPPLSDGHQRRYSFVTPINHSYDTPDNTCFGNISNTPIRPPPFIGTYGSAGKESPPIPNVYEPIQRRHHPNQRDQQQQQPIYEEIDRLAIMADGVKISSSSTPANYHRQPLSPEIRNNTNSPVYHNQLNSISSSPLRRPLSLIERYSSQYVVSPTSSTTSRHRSSTSLASVLPINEINENSEYSEETVTSTGDEHYTSHHDGPENNLAADGFKSTTPQRQQDDGSTVYEMSQSKSFLSLAQEKNSMAAQRFRSSQLNICQNLNDSKVSQNRASTNYLAFTVPVTEPKTPSSDCNTVVGFGPNDDELPDFIPIDGPLMDADTEENVIKKKEKLISHVVKRRVEQEATRAKKEEKAAKRREEMRIRQMESEKKKEGERLRKQAILAQYLEKKMLSDMPPTMITKPPLHNTPYYETTPYSTTSHSNYSTPLHNKTPCVIDKRINNSLLPHRFEPLSGAQPEDQCRKDRFVACVKVQPPSSSHPNPLACPTKLLPYSRTQSFTQKMGARERARLILTRPRSGIGTGPQFGGNINQRNGTVLESSDETSEPVSLANVGYRYGGGRLNGNGLASTAVNDHTSSATRFMRPLSSAKSHYSLRDVLDKGRDDSYSSELISIIPRLSARKFTNCSSNNNDKHSNKTVSTINLLPTLTQNSSSSSDMSANLSGTKLYLKPIERSNRTLIIQALNYSVLAGNANQDLRSKALEAMAKSENKHFLILFRDRGMQYRAIYQYGMDRDELHKIHGTGPRVVTEQLIQYFYKYNSGSKSFVFIQSKHISATIDAFVIKEMWWQNKKQFHASGGLLIKHQN